MPTNDFLAFAAAAGANVLTQAEYAALTAVVGPGFSAGTAESVQCNKVWRQATLIAAMIGQFIVDKSGQPAVDDGTTATLEANFIIGIQALITAFGYATIASPTFTGVPAAPTPATADNTTKIATTSFVKAVLTAYATLASPALTGVPTAPTAATTDNSGTIANTAFVKAVLTAYATLASPTFSGAPRTPTPGAGDASSQIPNTFWVATYFASLGYVNGTFAPAVSPGFSGVPTTPTPSFADSSAQIPNTFWAKALFAQLASFASSISGPGSYQRLPSGVIIQWGLSASIPPGTGGGIFYPLTFPNNVLSVVASYSNNANQADATAGNPLNAWTNPAAEASQFVIYNGGNASSQYRWIAIGF